MRITTLALALCAVAAPAVSAQHGGAAPPRTSRPPAEASQYDFLIGQWELTVTPKVSGLAARIHGVPKMRGSWKAWRALDGWGVEDELRIVDASGNPQAFTHSLRAYDPAGRRWQLAAVEAYRHTVSQASAQWSGTEMVSTGKGVDDDGRAYVTRTRIGRITPASFRFQQDRSYDDGKTWDLARLVIDAKRVAAAAPR